VTVDDGIDGKRSDDGEVEVELGEFCNSDQVSRVELNSY
jgi:hypothetical protein